ncbi:MAG: cytochrome c [Deltaproteobacteria bacterium]|nr:MAG: cytochrome c [Deltaproteobacteria bacterium]
MNLFFKGRNFRPTFLLIVLILFSCTKDKRLEGKSEAEIKLIDRGRTVYMTTCVVCHHPNPALDGPTGPAISGSSLVLIKEKLLKGGYPEGYKAKRSTHLMPTFIEEHENDIDAIHAFLNL